MRALIAKEIQLVGHPSSYFLVVLGALVLVPSWPYAVVLLYGILIAFFNAMNAREFHDLSYTFALPVSRGDMVRARVGVMVGIEVVMVAIMALFVCARISLGINEIAMGQSFVGLPANISLLGFSLGAFGIFNLVFFTLYYKDPLKVGIPFLIACIPFLVFCGLFEALPFVPIEACGLISASGFGNIGAQLVVLGAGIIVFAVLNWGACRLATRAFADYDA